MDHADNVVAAATMGLADRLRAAIEDAAGRAGGGAAALTALHAWADGEPIEGLAAGLDLSHSRAVRVVDRLAADGLVRRAPDPTDGRRTLIALTPAGRRTARAILAARERALDEALAPLTAQQRDALTAAAEVLVGGLVTSRRASRVVCRHCDTRACGHGTGACPATRRADELEPVP